MKVQYILDHGGPAYLHSYCDIHFTTNIGFLTHLDTFDNERLTILGPINCIW